MPQFGNWKYYLCEKFIDMKPFLQQVAEHYYNLGNIEKRCFVFPNRRSMAFFKKWLGEAVVSSYHAGTVMKPLVMPQMTTVNDLFFKVAGVSPADRVAQLLDLYDCYKELNPKAEPLDEFIFWGDVILGDFNDVDKYYVDPKQLFTNVADFKALQDNFAYLTETQRRALENFISHFNDLSGRLTVDLDTDDPDVKGRFLMIWNILYPLYTSFNEKLYSKVTAYEGMVYRSLAERLKEESIDDVFSGVFPDDSDFVFVGLNALNECEKMLLRKLRDCSRAEFCWDYSGEMIQDPQNRSSLFMSENVLEFPQAYEWDTGLTGVPAFNVVSVSSSVGQAKRLPDILGGIDEAVNGGDMSKTAVVLPDESLLIPVLNSIPESVHDINVTMGLPMTGSLLYTMMNDISSIQLHAMSRGGKWYFYHKQVWDLFSNDLFRNALDDESSEKMSAVRKAAQYYIPQEHLNGTAFLDAIFRPVITDPKVVSISQIHEFAEYQKSVIGVIASKVSADAKMMLELEYAKEYYKCVNVLDSYGLGVLPITYVRLQSQILSGVSVPFRGEPLKGLQIMGPLEMRALDFRNLIIMSANEGVFPRRSVSSSFIPPELRKGFGLPTYEYQDAVWAYYFYRAISRAENVWMLVDSRTEGLKSGEESRYIKQLEYHFGIPLQRYVVKFDEMGVSDAPAIIKTDADVEKIKETVLSATAVQNYLACPARFYYGTVKGLKAEDEVVESLDYGMFGTVFHDTMRAIYTAEEAMSPDFVFDRDGRNVAALNGKLESITRDYIKSWLQREEDIGKKVKSLIIIQLKSIDVSGRNLVVADVIVRYVLKTLRRDLELLEESGLESFRMLGLEMPVYGEFHGQRFRGFIDRIDSFETGQARVVDYKTGKVLRDDEEIYDGNAEDIAEKIFMPDVSDRPKIAFQFYIYDMLLKNYELIKGRRICNSVYSTANIFKEAPKTLPLNDIFYESVSVRLKELLDQMRDPAVPFRRTEDEKVCTYCDFKIICGR